MKEESRSSEEKFEQRMPWMTGNQIAIEYGFNSAAPSHPMSVQALAAKESCIKTCSRMKWTMEPRDASFSVHISASIFLSSCVVSSPLLLPAFSRFRSSSWLSHRWSLLKLIGEGACSNIPSSIREMSVLPSFGFEANQPLNGQGGVPAVWPDSLPQDQL
jgi:hypothetical protein